MTTKTVRMKASEITKDWHVVDAAGRPLGRVATEIATLLRGKHKPTFEPHLDGGDFVIVINASQIRLSGGKTAEKVYYRHSGYPGGLKARSFTEQLKRHPHRVIEDAVWGMLPGGPLGKKILRHLKVYPGPDHPHASQITGSERAQAAREVAAAETLFDARKPRRLRPLAVPQSNLPTLEEEFPEAAAAVEDAAPSPVAAKVETALPVDQSGAAAEATLEPETVVEAEEAPVAKKPRARRPKAAAEPTTEIESTSETEE